MPLDFNFYCPSLCGTAWVEVRDELTAVVREELSTVKPNEVENSFVINEEFC